MVVANTGDDFEHLGLAISPDRRHAALHACGARQSGDGWGRRGETWTFMAALDAFGGETWFRLGDGDLATHVERTRRLRAGEAFRIIDDFRRRLGIAARIVPMSDDPVRTRVRTPKGWLDFQDYFVRLQCAPAVLELPSPAPRRRARMPEFFAALADPQLRAVVICPSNPFISIEPILAARRGARGAARRRRRRSSRCRRSSPAARSRGRPRR